MYKYTNLEKIRKENRKNQTQIAEVLNVTQQQYGMYERGERELPMHHFVTLARYYNVSLDYLAGLIDVPRKLYAAQTSAPGKSVSISNRGSNNKFNIKQ